MPRFLAIALCAAGALGIAPGSRGAEIPDLERGRKLYENHCIVCHTAKVHRRVPPLPLQIDELRRIVALWASMEGMRWSSEEIEDVVHYLNRTHYRFEK
jgi:mono/diheme cytochrome c family protein